MSKFSQAVEAPLQTPVRPWVAAYEDWTGVPDGYFAEVPESELPRAGWDNYRAFKAAWDARDSMALKLLHEFVAAYRAMPDGPLGRGLTNGMFLRAEAMVTGPNVI